MLSIESDCNVEVIFAKGVETVSVVEVDAPPELAVIVEVPAATPVASPPELIVAVAVVAELHVTLPVMFATLLSEYVPVAVNCCVVPFTIVGFAGVTAIDTSVAGVTVNTVEPEMAPEVALIVEVPAATPVASPPALIVAVAVVAELHVTLPVMFAVLLSEYVPVAVNCCVVPFTIDGFAGVTAIDTSVAGVTVSMVEPRDRSRGRLDRRGSCRYSRRQPACVDRRRRWCPLNSTSHCL